MPRRNRVDPWGDLHAVHARGMFTGNRGCLVNDRRELVRHHSGSLWIICETDFRGWKHELDAPRRWTPLFFLDEAVALAAGHRPCAFCRPAAYRAYRQAVIAGTSGAVSGKGVTAGLDAGADSRTWSAGDINRQLAGERHARGRGLVRAGDRRLWRSPLDSLPDGAVVVWDGLPHLVLGGGLHQFGFDGWGTATDRPASATVHVVTPPLSVLAIAHGYSPVLSTGA